MIVSVGSSAGLGVGGGERQGQKLKWLGEGIQKLLASSENGTNVHSPRQLQDITDMPSWMVNFEVSQCKEFDLEPYVTPVKIPLTPINPK